MTKFSFLTIGIATALTMVSCDKNEVSNPTQDYKEVLINVTNDVIIGTYEDLYDKTQLLVNTLSVLETSQTVANLDAAKQAWRDARSPWEQAEGFLFGPVEQKGLDPSIDSWPVNEPDLDAVLNSGVVLNKSYVDGLDGTLKGFHTVEYLLFGADGNKPIGAFTSREFEYLRACSESLNGATQELYYSWDPAHQNFAANVINAGSNNFYPSQKSALQELVTGFITIADEVANGKINDPFTQQNLTLEESRFSANSKADFANNIRSIKNAYLGKYKNATGIGLTQIIAEENSVLDEKLKQQIDDAINAIESIQGTFTTAIFSAPQTVQTAQTKVRTLQQTLESELLPLISNL